jgi:ATP-dependent protease Clp ATPase subunit
MEEKKVNGKIGKEKGEFLEKLDMSVKEAEKRIALRKGVYEPVTLTPKEIYKKLDEKVFGQEEAKKSLSVILYEHMARCKMREEGIKLRKMNAMLVGPTGCGKTLIARTLSEIAEVPFIKVDATSLVQRGYRGGMHSEQIINLLISAAGGAIRKAENGIVFIDELDKLACAGEMSGEIATEGVQYDLLSMIDGGQMFYEPDGSEYARRKIDMGNVLFLFGGAFSKVESMVNTQIMTRYGLMPEFVARIGSIINLEPLSKEVICKLVGQHIDDYAYILPISKHDKWVYSKLLSGAILNSGMHKILGGRAVGPMVRRFFKEKIFEIKRDARCETRDDI